MGNNKGVVVKNKARSSPLHHQMNLKQQNHHHHHHNNHNNQQQQQQEKQKKNQQQIRDATPPQIPSEKRKSNPNPKSPSSTRRSTRSNPNPQEEDHHHHEGDSIDEEEEEEEEEEELLEKRREKKMKLVLRIQSENSPLDSASPSDSNPYDEIEERIHKKRKIEEVVEAPLYASKPRSFQQGTTPFEPVGHESLPDRKWLLFLLERLQKKDTYGVFSEPVDPKELPDYHDVIEHPMDFGTVRKKLDGRAYVSLEQFETDILLICSNALQYNATDTIYFRQARSIQELAKKSFESFRQDGENMITVPKVARRGRPPKYLKNPQGRPPLDRAASESSGAMHLPGREANTTFSAYDLRRASNKTVAAELSTQVFRNHYIGDNHTRSFDEQKAEKRDDPVGYAAKAHSLKNGKKQFVLDENRRHTYRPSSHEAAESSVFNTFNEEVKHLMAVGLHSELGYARSLARFSAGTGPLVWEICSRRIERCLPAGTRFGRGWIDEDDTSSSRTSRQEKHESGDDTKPAAEPNNPASISQVVEEGVSRGTENQAPWTTRLNGCTATGGTVSGGGGITTKRVLVCDSAQPDLALQL